MALKPKLDTLEGLDEALKSYYKAGTDGKFVLDLEDDGRMKALHAERERADKAEKALKDREKIEEESKRKTEEELALKRGEFDKVRAQDQEALKKAQDENAALLAKIQNGARDRALMEALADPSVKGIPKALLPHLQSQVEVIADGEDFKVVPKGNPGQKLTEFISGLKKDMPWGFEGVNANGGGAQNPGKTNTTETTTTNSHAMITAGLKEMGVGA